LAIELSVLLLLTIELSVLLLLTIELSVLLRLTASDYPIGIFKLFLCGLWIQGARHCRTSLILDHREKNIILLSETTESFDRKSGCC